MANYYWITLKANKAQPIGSGNNFLVLQPGKKQYDALKINAIKGDGEFLELFNSGKIIFDSSTIPIGLTIKALKTEIEIPEKEQAELADKKEPEKEIKGVKTEPVPIIKNKIEIKKKSGGKKKNE